MLFGLDPEHEELQQAAIAFARKRLTFDVSARDRSGTFSRDGWRACAEFGVHGLPIPREYGGRGEGLLATIAVMEGLGYGCADHGLLFSINAHLWSVAMPILLHGTSAQKERYLPGLSDGTAIGANAASEPDAGSDVFALRTRAVRDGDGYVLDGAKSFVSNAPVADLFLTYATADPARGVMGISAFLVERTTPGVTVRSSIDKTGLRTSPMAEITFDEVRVPAHNRLGREGRGAEVFHSSMEWERGCILASCLGTMRRQLEECIAHARRRKQFGQAIGKFQSVANRIVAMKLRLETARPLIYQVGSLKENGQSAELESAMAKLYVSEAFVESCLDAIQIHGGYGYTTALPYERELRDAIGGTLYSGTSEIQRHIIATKLGL
jgi:alkylation response protein AidB-like acyl-CoA dehydrogenase